LSCLSLFAKKASAQTWQAPTLYGWYTATYVGQTWNTGVGVGENICVPLGITGGFGYNNIPVGPLSDQLYYSSGISLGHVSVGGNEYYQVTGNGDSLIQPSMLVGCYSNTYFNNQFGFQPGTYYVFDWTASSESSTNMIAEGGNAFCWFAGFTGQTNGTSCSYTGGSDPLAVGVTAPVNPPIYESFCPNGEDCYGIFACGGASNGLTAWGECQTWNQNSTSIMNPVTNYIGYGAPSQQTMNGMFCFLMVWLVIGRLAVRPQFRIKRQILGRSIQMNRSK
jgi:hypothetical protein